jgi:DNA-binding response OmpR family regulator
MTEARPRLLVVDDDRAMVSMLVAGLARAGFEAVVAINADEGRRLAAELRPALALVDVQTLDGHGFELAGYLAHEAKVPFLVLAPARDAEMRRRAESCGACAVLSKPIEFSRLVPAIRAALEAPARAPARAPSGDGLLADALEGDHGPQTLIALGILVERHRVNCDEAVRLLHQRAEAAGRPLDEFALALIEQAESAGPRSV